MIIMDTKTFYNCWRNFLQSFCSLLFLILNMINFFDSLASWMINLMLLCRHLFFFVGLILRTYCFFFSFKSILLQHMISLPDQSVAKAITEKLYNTFLTLSNAQIRQMLEDHTRVDSWLQLPLPSSLYYFFPSSHYQKAVEEWLATASSDP